MAYDLFGQDVSQDSICARTLREYDKDTFLERKKRCEYFFSLVPDTSVWISSDESYFIWLEIRLAFINGCYISTILLALAFIERKFQADYHMLLDFKRSEQSLNKILNEMRKDKSLDTYWIERIDQIRKKRNPLAHFKNVMKPESISNLSISDPLKAAELLEQDAKKALEIMFAVSRMQFTGKANLL